MHSLSGFTPPFHLPRHPRRVNAQTDFKLLSSWIRPTPDADCDRFEVTSGPKTGVASSPDTKKSINCGRPAADVNKGKSLKKMTIVEFLRIKKCDLDNHQLGLEHPTCHRYPDALVRSDSEPADPVSSFSNASIGGLFCFLAPQRHALILFFLPHSWVMAGWLILNKQKIKKQPGLALTLRDPDFPWMKLWRHILPDEHFRPGDPLHQRGLRAGNGTRPNTTDLAPATGRDSECN